MSKPNHTEPAGDESLEVSKSQRKRDANVLLDLAKQLIAMPATRLKRLPMDQDLRDEVDFARSIRSHGARKRQLMTVGKMLRKRDTEALLTSGWPGINRSMTCVFARGFSANRPDDTSPPAGFH